MAYFLSQSVRNLLAKAIGLKFSSSFCHRVAPSPVLQASVVMKFSFLDQSVLSVVFPLFPFFNCSKSSFISFVHSHFVSFFSNLLILSVFFWIDYSKILISVVSSPEMISIPWCLWVLSISLSLLFLSLIGFTPFWFISYPNQVSFFKQFCFFLARSVTVFL